MVNFDGFTTRPVDKVVSETGYICPNCGKWEHVLYRTVSLDELLREVERLPANSGKRKRMFRKLITKAQNLQEGMRDQKNGSSRNHNQTSPGYMG